MQAASPIEAPLASWFVVVRESLCSNELVVVAVFLAVPRDLFPELETSNPSELVGHGLAHERRDRRVSAAADQCLHLCERGGLGADYGLLSSHSNQLLRFTS